MKKGKKKGKGVLADVYMQGIEYQYLALNTAPLIFKALHTILVSFLQQPSKVGAHYYPHNNGGLKLRESSLLRAT